MSAIPYKPPRQPRTPVIAKRQIELLKVLLDVDEIEVDAFKRLKQLPTAKTFSVLHGLSESREEER